MQNRHYLEEALSNAIKAESSYDIINHFIKMIKITPKASLTSLDETNANFLSQALRENLSVNACLLLLKEIINDKIIFAADESENDAFWYAASGNYIEIVEALLALANQKEQDNKENTFWLNANQVGQTPLHIALQHNNIAIAKLLIEKIIKLPDKINLLNKTDKHGNTFLHYALKKNPPNIEIIRLLLANGADLNITNNKGELPCSLFLRFNKDEQITFFTELNKENEENKTTANAIQQSILSLMHQACKEKYATKIVPAEEEIARKSLKENYLQLASYHSLKAAIIAKLAFDDRFRVRDIVSNMALLPDELKTAITQDPPYVTADLIFPYQYLNEDRKTLLRLIEQTQKLVDELKKKPQELTAKQKLVSPIACMVVWLIIELFLSIADGIQSTKYRQVLDKYRDPLDSKVVAAAKEKKTWDTAMIFSSLSLMVFILFAIYAWIERNSVVLKASKKDLSTLYNELKTELFDNLLLIEEKQADFLPIEKELFDQLKERMETLSQDQPLPDAINKLNNLITLLHDILTQSNIKNQSFTLFAVKNKPIHQEVKIEIVPNDPTEDEETPLVAQRRMANP